MLLSTFHIKTQALYWYALYWVIVDTGWKLDPSTVACDFEKILINAVNEQFQGCAINGLSVSLETGTSQKNACFKI